MGIESIKKVFSELLNSPTIYLLLLFCLTQWLINFYNSEYITTDELFEQYIEERQAEKYGDDYDALAAEFGDDIDDLEEAEEQYWFDHLFDFGIISLLSVIQFVITTAFIYVGLTLYEKTDQFKFNEVFKVCILAEFVFFLPVIIKMIWFSFIETDFDFTTIKNFHPLSLLSLVGHDNVQDWQKYPLSALNLFEVLFVWLCVLGVRNLSNLDFNTVAKPVIGAYVILLFTWVSLRLYLNSLF